MPGEAKDRAEAHNTEVLKDMDLKEVYTALEKVENGAELITAIKTEVNKLNNEAKRHREAGEQSGKKLKDVLIYEDYISRWND